MLHGDMIIAGTRRTGAAEPLHAINPSNDDVMAPAFGGATTSDVAEACALAAEAFRAYRDTGLEARAVFLETIAANILGIGDELIERAMAETGLPRGRLEGERGRTVGQLRLFAQVARGGDWIGARIDPALPERQPAPRADLRLRHIAIGPVVVFGASNFPLAFSVAGGDTASALAAGCPVVVKAHPAHPGTSELVGQAIAAAVETCGMPAGTFSLLFGTGNEIGAALVSDPHIKAVGFTGSRGGGLALMQIAAARPQPIPVYAEMSSINPVILFPAALAARGGEIARGFAASLTMGVGQFCTNPGLLLALDGEQSDAFAAAAGTSVSAAAAATMLTPGIHNAYDRGRAALAGHADVAVVAQGVAASGPNQGEAAFYETRAAAFLADPRLQDEVFGPSSLMVHCPDLAALTQVIEQLEGQLTIALHMEPEDYPLVAQLLPLLEEKAGRILVNGFGTGVEVAHAMVHGGPFPATSDPRSTSVGTLAIERFLRPVCYQDLPAGLLPEALLDGNPLNLWRLTEGKLGRD
jgi:alpha-ketoglutaric semialdehyde dehydrogenase